MTPEALRAALEAMAAQAGVAACALVELETGMAWQAAGRADFLPLAEAASDYWRYGRRQHRTFEALGAVRAQVVIHERGRLTIVPCGLGLLLVLLTEEPDRVDWPAWKRAAAALQAGLSRP